MTDDRMSFENGSTALSSVLIGVGTKDAPVSNG